MARKLILTPYEHGFMAGIDSVINESPLNVTKSKIDIPHLLCSSLIMSGVDIIESPNKISDSTTKLIKEVDPLESYAVWRSATKNIKEVFDTYKSETKPKEFNEAISDYSNRIEQIMYALKTKSGVLTFSPINQIQNEELLPLELKFPFEILFAEIQTENANLPILKHDLPKKDFDRLIDVIQGKEYKNYTEAQMEIEHNESLTNRTIVSIEKAGKELYNKNKRILNLRDNLIKALPLSSKIIELFFGKLPGIITNYSSGILSEYLEGQKTIPIYNCQSIVSSLLEKRMKEVRHQIKK